MKKEDIVKRDEILKMVNDVKALVDIYSDMKNEIDGKIQELYNLIGAERITRFTGNVSYSRAKGIADGKTTIKKPETIIKTMEKISLISESIADYILIDKKIKAMSTGYDTKEIQKEEYIKLNKKYKTKCFGCIYFRNSSTVETKKIKNTECLSRKKPFIKKCSKVKYLWNVD